MQQKNISQDEVDKSNTEFFNSGMYNMNNLMLSSEYKKPEEINLFQLFYNGLGEGADQISEDEKDLLSKLSSDAPYLDVIKVTVDEMDGFLQEKTGIGLEETQKSGLDGFYYLEAYNSYYLIVGDTNYQRCNVVLGTREEKDIIKLQYQKEYEQGKWLVTLQKTDRGYLFVSNIKIN